jgi:hypothetical protein
LEVRVLGRLLRRAKAVLGEAGLGRWISWGILTANLKHIT